MESRYEITGIEPFNEIFYKTCFYPPLLTVVYFYGGNILPFLANDVFTYNYDDNCAFKLLPECKKLKSELEITSNMGIIPEPIIAANDLIETIKESVSENYPVFIPVDRFYYSTDSEPDYYNEMHWEHYFLIIGFDDKNGRFKIVDTNVNKCFIREIDYEEVMTCYRGYERWDENKKNVCIMKMKKGQIPKGNMDDDYLRLFREIMICNRDEVLANLENIKALEQFYLNCLEDFNRFLSLEQDNITAYIFRIISSKKVEMYRVYKFFGEQPEIFEIINNINDKFQLIQSMLFKLCLIQRFDEKLLKTVIKKLDEIYRLENLYYEKLFCLLGMKEEALL